MCDVYILYIWSKGKLVFCKEILGQNFKNLYFISFDKIIYIYINLWGIIIYTKLNQ